MDWFFFFSKNKKIYFDIIKKQAHSCLTTAFSNAEKLFVFELFAKYVNC